MKKAILSLLFSSLLIACNNSAPASVEDETIADEATNAEITDLDKDPYVKIDSDESLIATAMMAAPVESREDVTVIGYNMAGEFDTLKKGNNEFICLADDPNKEGFSAACYHKSLEPFMARGRELKAEGKSHQEIFDMREEEVKTGKLNMGENGATLHVYYSATDTYNPKTNEVADAHYRYVVYMPYATAASTGLPEEPVAPNHPWIMNPGTHRAHIMISPVKGETK